MCEIPAEVCAIPSETFCLTS